MREREGGSSTITNCCISASPRFQCYVFFFLHARRNFHQKNQGSTRSEFCEILSPKPPAFRKISLAFRISALRLLYPQNIVAECRAFPRTSASAEAPRFAWWRFSARGTLVITILKKCSSLVQ